MTVEQRKKQLAVRTGILGVSLLVGITVGVVACGSHSSSGNPTESVSSESETVTDTEIESVTDTETVIETIVETETEKPVLDAAVRLNFDVEVGTKTELVTEDFFTEYSGQVFTVGKALTAEELRVVGAVYEVPVLCDDVEGVVTVKVVDTTAPVIEGTKNRTVYKDASVSYRKNITVTDNSGETITLEVDASQVDTSVLGSYIVKFFAKDSSGNTATTEITIKVVDRPIINEETVRPEAEKIVNSLVKEGMTEYEKAWVLYQWCIDNKNIVYVGTKGDRTSIWTGAYEGLVKGRGDCFTFYSTYAALLEVVGIENMMVSRVGERTSNHYWNLVKIDGQWYHCDTSARRVQDEWWLCFMQTDAQVEAYTRSYPEKPNYFTFDKSLYPERATTIIYESRHPKYGYTITEKYGIE